MQKAYLTAINRTPKIWQGFYNWMDESKVVETNLNVLLRMRQSLEDLLRRTQPDAVVSTYPIYNYLIDEIYSSGRARHFRQITIITDSISINSVWYRCQSDFFIVPNEPTVGVLCEAGIPVEKIKPLGFPVQLKFAYPPADIKLPDPTEDNPRVLYIINSGKAKAPKIVRELLEKKDWQLTITTGRDKALFKDISKIIKGEEGRAQVIGWSNQIPELLMTHHAVITKAGGATVQEAIAARCPMILNQIVPGQEEGNYELIRRANAGALAEGSGDIVPWLERAFAEKAALWQQWRWNLTEISVPDSALRIARFILDESIRENREPIPPTNSFETRSQAQVIPMTRSSGGGNKRLLLCDFHTHTTFSDGKLTVQELVDFYGTRQFDCLCITDHYADPGRLLGKICNLSGLVIAPNRIEEYFETIEREKKRAWEKYEMLLLTGIEFNKDGYTKKTSAHLLGIDLKKPIDPSLDIKTIIHEIHQQGALAVASHPHEMKSSWGKDTLYLWENQDEFAPLLDAWEIANRDDIFNPVGLKRLPFLGNSDFHKPKHIQSWKSMLYCEKDPEAIKECIRINRDVALTLYREHRFASQNQPENLELQRDRSELEPQDFQIPEALLASTSQM